MIARYLKVTFAFSAAFLNRHDCHNDAIRPFPVAAVVTIFVRELGVTTMIILASLIITLEHSSHASNSWNEYLKAWGMKAKEGEVERGRSRTRVLLSWQK